jgi:predicted MFS family arabinose efflux permease
MSWRPRVVILSVGTFVIGTDAFIVAGVQPDISSVLGVDATAVGQLITVFAITYAVASPVLGALTGRWERRQLLLAALAIFVVGNVLAAVTPNYGWMLVARVIAGAGAALFTPTAAATGAMLVPPEVRARALALVSGGITVATVIGVPVVALLGNEIGFRVAFGVIAAAGVLAGIVIRFALPAVPVPGGTTLAQRIAVVRVPGVAVTLLVSVCAFVGGFTTYNYIAPLFTDRLGISATAVTWLLLAFGVGGAIGNFLGGELSDRMGAFRVVTIGLVLASVGLLLIALVGDTWPGAVTAIVIWGIGGWMQLPAQQHRLVQLAGAAAPLAISLNSSAMYLGISLAGVVGGIVISAGSIDFIPVFGAIMGVLGLVLTAAFYRSRVAAPRVGAERA